MRRFQLIEVLDQSWCPQGLRDTLTDYLQFTISLNNPYIAIVPAFAQALQATHTTCIVDMCAGSGGPWQHLRPTLERMLGYSLTLVLTDRFPSTSLDENNATSSIAADARSLPIGVPVFRTVFAGFHHFAPRDAQLVLQDAVAQRHGIAIFEATQRRAIAMALIGLSAISMLVVTPFIRPWRWSRLLWTYLIPIAPLVVLFDGIVSCLRTYTIDEMREFINRLDAGEYVWQIGEAPIANTPLTVPYAIGYPRTN